MSIDETCNKNLSPLLISYLPRYIIRLLSGDFPHIVNKTYCKRINENFGPHKGEQMSLSLYSRGGSKFYRGKEEMLSVKNLEIRYKFLGEK